MKYYKTYITQPNGSEMVYPPLYNQIAKNSVDYLYFKENGLPRRLDVVEDVNAVDVSTEPLIEEIAEADVKVISEGEEVRTEDINDEGKIRRIEIKSRLGEALTVDEKKAIDPDNPTSGIVRKKILADRLADHKELEALGVRRRGRAGRDV